MASALQDHQSGAPDLDLHALALAQELAHRWRGQSSAVQHVVRLTSYGLASVAQVAAMEPGVLGVCLDLPIEGREWAVGALQGACRAPSRLRAMPAPACGLAANVVAHDVHELDDDCEGKAMETDDGEGKDSDGGEEEGDQPDRGQRSSGVNQRTGFENALGAQEPAAVAGESAGNADAAAGGEGRSASRGAGAGAGGGAGDCRVYV